MAAVVNEKPKSFSRNTTISCLQRLAKSFARKQMWRMSFDTGAVFISLDRLERGRLISSKPVKVESYDEPQLVFSVTAEGKRMLSEVRTGAKRLVEALADFE